MAPGPQTRLATVQVFDPAGARLHVCRTLAGCIGGVEQRGDLLNEFPFGKQCADSAEESVIGVRQLPAASQGHLELIDG